LFIIVYSKIAEIEDHEEIDSGGFADRFEIVEFWRYSGVDRIS